MVLFLHLPSQRSMPTPRVLVSSTSGKGKRVEYSRHRTLKRWRDPMLPYWPSNSYQTLLSPCHWEVTLCPQLSSLPPPPPPAALWSTRHSCENPGSNVQQGQTSVTCGPAAYAIFQRTKALAPAVQQAVCPGRMLLALILSKEECRLYRSTLQGAGLQRGASPVQTPAKCTPPTQSPFPLSLGQPRPKGQSTCSRGLESGLSSPSGPVPQAPSHASSSGQETDLRAKILSAGLCSL